MELWQIVLLAALPIPNLWGIRHAFYHDFPAPHERLIWMGVCIFVPVIGGLAYMLFGFRRSKEFRENSSR
ncbi:MAG: PLD nuclease N-terminal domain-containing protein [Desulfovibrio sp.]|jgi:hypothetical protein|nr:PLD nuclease N-terminal domain-containing protein [Desulfovibrio sp.]